MTSGQRQRDIDCIDKALYKPKIAFQRCCIPFVSVTMLRTKMLNEAMKGLIGDQQQADH